MNLKIRQATRRALNKGCVSGWIKTGGMATGTFAMAVTVVKLTEESVFIKARYRRSPNAFDFEIKREQILKGLKNDHYEDESLKNKVYLLVPMSLVSDMDERGLEVI